jgi:protein TonB
MWVIASIKLDTEFTREYDIPSLKVNLMAIASPAVSPEPKRIIKTSQTPNAKVVNKKIKTPNLLKQENAFEKISLSEKQKIKEDIDQKKNMETFVEEVIEFSPVPDVAKKNEKPVVSPKLASLSQSLGKQNSTIIHKAKYRSQTPPLYPRRSFELGQQGTVILLAQINSNGKPKVLEVEESSGHQLLDSAALAAVKKWEFEPIRIKDHAIVSWVRVPVRFVIQ